MNHRSIPIATVVCALLGTASAAVAQGAPGACVAPGSSLRLDHVPIAVGDLGALSQRLTDEFGFRIRSPEPDENGLATASIPFGDGTRLALRTMQPASALGPDAPGAVEAQRYADLIADGGGGAYLAFSGPAPAGVLEIAGELEPELAAVSAGAGGRVAFPRGHPLHPVFFVTSDRESVTSADAAPHPNGARGLEAVWVMVEDPERLTRFLLAFGARDCGPSRHPEHLYGRALGIRGGTVYIVDARLWMADPESAPVVSLTVRGAPESVSDNIVLGNAGGLWIELRPSDAGSDPLNPAGPASPADPEENG
ncbi:VOC family protein [Candidatus Palauibacter sp.]|uniref:VOC family protein n=1 Tax=Candidatus Palauibacter sp. TaxID=3101350 RepID=UPI003D152FF4